MVYCTRRFVLSFVLCYFVLVFFSPLSIAITYIGEERANLNVFVRLFDLRSFFFSFFFLFFFFFFLFPLPLCNWEGLRLVTVALPGFFSYLSFGIAFELSPLGMF